MSNFRKAVETPSVPQSEWAREWSASDYKKHEEELRYLNNLYIECHANPIEGVHPTHEFERRAGGLNDKYEVKSGPYLDLQEKMRKVSNWISFNRTPEEELEFKRKIGEILKPVVKKSV